MKDEIMTNEVGDYVKTTPEEYAAAMALFAVEDAEAIEREGMLLQHFGEDVRTLHKFAIGRTGVSRICTQVLIAMHHKTGAIDVDGLRQLDAKNRGRVLRLLDILSTPMLVPHEALSSVLSDEEIAQLTS